MAEAILLFAVLVGILSGILVRITAQVSAYSGSAILVASGVLTIMSMQLAKSTGVTMSIWHLSFEAHYQTFFLGVFGASSSSAVLATAAAQKLFALFRKILCKQ